MSGLTAANVETILEKLDDCVDTLEQTHAHNLAANLADLVDEIQQMQRDNIAQASRPDRVGDECWCGTWERSTGIVWRRGILRAWRPGGCPAIVEDAETKKIDYFSRISFASEAPK
jgi:uncharacterized coiled-coil protein SlyX